MSLIPTNKQAYFPELDILRGISAFLVVLYHVHFWGTIGAGQAAMELFFCLSGFLITFRLLEEYLCNSSISLFRFYYRRAMRLLPNLIAFVLFLSALSNFIVFPGSEKSLHWSFFTVFFTVNWAEIVLGSSGLYSGCWSLAIEEQFYIVWPLLILMVEKNSFSTKKKVLFGVMILIASAIARILICDDVNSSLLRMRNGTDTRIFGLICGSVAAFCTHGFRDLLPFVQRISTSGILTKTTALAMIISVVFTREYTKTTFLTAWALFPCLAAVFIFCLCSQRLYVASNSEFLNQDVGNTSSAHVLSQFKPLVLRFFKWIGKISYSLYLWHGIVLWFLERHIGMNRITLIPCGIIASVAVGYFFWRFVEMRFYKPRF
jgi:peptidoglycan/LPS O-acetylase OafA/YrhL